MQNVSFSVDGQKINGMLFHPQVVKDKNPAVLFIHGWMSSQRSPYKNAVALAELGFICLTYDLRSHGDSEGDRKVLSRKNYLQDVAAAYDFLSSQKGVDATRIGIVGSSFGGYLAALASQIRNVRWLVMRVPANYQDENFELPQSKYPRLRSKTWRSKKLSVQENKALQALQEFAGDVLIIESELDELVPHPTIQNYIDAITNKDKLSYILMPGADHSLKRPKDREKLTNILLDWFSVHR